jgi:hypothetical protein
MVEQCHFTYVTKFKPSQEEICDENFEKKCQISFKQQAYNETVKKCYKPVRKVRGGKCDNFEKCQKSEGELTSSSSNLSSLLITRQKNAC